MSFLPPIRRLIACAHNDTHPDECRCAYDAASTKLFSGEEGRGLFAIACGCGKSRVIVHLASQSPSRLCVIVFPTLSLVRDFVANNIKPFRFIFGNRIIGVSSDTDISDDPCDGSALNREKGAARIEMTTIVETLTKFLVTASVSKCLILSTYASLSSTRSSIRAAGISPDNVFVQFEEAHHAVESRNINPVFDDPFAARAAFFTATPINRNGVVMYPPLSAVGDRTRHCGEVLIDISYSVARDAGVLKPFEIIMGITDKTILTVDAKGKSVSVTKAGRCARRSAFERIIEGALRTGNGELICYTRRATPGKCEEGDTESDEDEKENNVIKATASDVLGRANADASAAFKSVLARNPTLAEMFGGGVCLSHISSSDKASGVASKVKIFDAKAIENRVSHGTVRKVIIFVSCKRLCEGIDTKHATGVVFVNSKRSPVEVEQCASRGLRLCRCEICEKIRVDVPDFDRAATLQILASIHKSEYDAVGAIENEDEADAARDALIRREATDELGAPFEQLVNIIAAMTQHDRALKEAITADLRCQKRFTELNRGCLKKVGVKVDTSQSFKSASDTIKAASVVSGDKRIETVETFVVAGEDAITAPSGFSITDEEARGIMTAVIETGRNVVVHFPDGGPIMFKAGEVKEEVHIIRDVSSDDFVRTVGRHGDEEGRRVVGAVQRRINGGIKTSSVGLGGDAIGRWRIEDLCATTLTAALRFELINNLEERALEKARAYEEWRKAHPDRKPSHKLNSKSQAQKDTATEADKTEHRQAIWRQNMKAVKAGRGRQKLYESVEEILIRVEGVDWHENEDLEEQALERARAYEEWRKAHPDRKPSHKLGGKSQAQQDAATAADKTEHQQAIWRYQMKTAKIGTGRSKLYESVEEILIRVEGVDWHENEDLEEQALERARAYEEWRKAHPDRKPSQKLAGKSKAQKGAATEADKTEHRQAIWRQMMKAAKTGLSGGHKLYESVEEILIRVEGVDWHENIKRTSSASAKTPSKTVPSEQSETVDSDKTSPLTRGQKAAATRKAKAAVPPPPSNSVEKDTSSDPKREREKRIKLRKAEQIKVARQKKAEGRPLNEEDQDLLEAEEEEEASKAEYGKNHDLEHQAWKVAMSQTFKRLIETFLPALKGNVFYFDDPSAGTNNTTGVLLAEPSLFPASENHRLCVANPDSGCCAALRAQGAGNVVQALAAEALKSKRFGKAVEFAAGYVDHCTGTPKDIIECLQGLLANVSGSDPYMILGYTLTARDPLGESQLKRLDTLRRVVQLGASKAGWEAIRAEDVSSFEELSYDHGGVVTRFWVLKIN
jgi:superfamily II DNA or RNA helicase